jgi:hypothetical protein
MAMMCMERSGSVAITALGWMMGDVPYTIYIMEKQ